MSDVRIGLVIAGKYRLEAPLAQGGMGSVWRARHLTLDTALAVKFIGDDVFALPEARKRFEREAKAAALLRSPHVVQIYDYGVEGNLPYLVMELLSGEDLGAHLKPGQRLSLEETTSIVIQVARALRRAAETGIVHRDLKPSNIFLLDGDDEEQQVKVLDFGIAKAPRGLRADDDTTKNGAIIGSPRYMSPEQARGSPLVDPRSDLWSLAVIAYRAITGQLPFQSTDMLDLIVKICSDTPAPPSSFDPSLGPEMDAFFVRALDRDPARRFQTAREMAAAFSRAAGLPPPSLSSFRTITRSAASGEYRMPELLAAPTRARMDSPPPVSNLGAPRSPTPEKHEPTRISAPPPSSSLEAPGRESPTPAEPASRRRVTPVPKGTPTPYPSDFDVPPQRTATLSRSLPWRVGAGVGLCALMAVMLLLLFSPWSRRRPLPPIADGAAAAPPPAPPSAPSAEPVAPVIAEEPPVAAPSADPLHDGAEDGPSPRAPGEPSAAPLQPLPKRPHGPAPAGGHAGKRKHAILGI